MLTFQVNNKVVHAEKLSYEEPYERLCSIWVACLNKSLSKYTVLQVRSQYKRQILHYVLFCGRPKYSLNRLKWFSSFDFADRSQVLLVTDGFLTNPIRIFYRKITWALLISQMITLNSQSTQWTNFNNWKQCFKLEFYWFLAWFASHFLATYLVNLFLWPHF